MTVKASNQQGYIIKAQAKPELKDDLNVWPLPDVELEIDDSQTNAIGKKPSWRFEPPEEEEVEEVVPLTAEEIEEIRQAAYQEGFNQGKEEGFETGYQEGKAQGHEEGLATGQQEGFEKGFTDGEQQVNELAGRWQGLVNELHHPMQSVEKNVEQQLLHLVVQLVEAITGHEAKTNQDILFSAITEGMKALPAQENQTQVYLHPEDIKRVESQFGEQFLAEHGWRLLPAPQLMPGSCQIENSTSNIDLSIKSKIKDVLDSFLQQALHQ